MAVEVVPGVLDDVETGSVVQRHVHAALSGDRAGVCGSGDLAVTQSSTPGMSVRVAAGYALVKGSTTTYQGMYGFHSDAAVDDLAIAPGDPTNPRNDIVVAQIRDATYAGADSDARLFVVQGTPAGSPSDPTLPASSLALARVRVDANESTSILNADITDLRVFSGDTEVRRRVDQSTELLTFIPGGNLDYTSTSEGNWFVVGNLNVPSWATGAVVEARVTSMFAQGGAAVGFWKATVATQTTMPLTRIDMASGDSDDSFGAARFTGLTPGGTAQVVVRAIMSSGQFRLTTSSRVFVTAHYRS